MRHALAIGLLTGGLTALTIANIAFCASYSSQDHMGVVWTVVLHTAGFAVGWSLAVATRRPEAR